MKSLLTISLLLISIEFNDVVNNQSLVRRAGGGGRPAGRRSTSRAAVTIATGTAGTIRRQRSCGRWKGRRN